MFPGLAVDKCYVGVLEVYENPRTLTMLDLMEVSLTTNIDIFCQKYLKFDLKEKVLTKMPTI